MAKTWLGQDMGHSAVGIFERAIGHSKLLVYEGLYSYYEDYEIHSSGFVLVMAKPVMILKFYFG